MTNTNTDYMYYHKLLYNQFLDELDPKSYSEVMRDPNGQEAQALGYKVHQAVKAILNKDKKSS